MLNSCFKGSKNRSTTRSLRGIIAFSVMVIDSGQTLRQQVTGQHSWTMHGTHTLRLTQFDGGHGVQQVLHESQQSR